MEDCRAQQQLDALLRGVRRGVKAPFARLPSVGDSSRILEPKQTTMLEGTDSMRSSNGGCLALRLEHLRKRVDDRPHAA